jgi:hypothetical protein
VHYPSKKLVIHSRIDSQVNARQAISHDQSKALTLKEAMILLALINLLQLSGGTIFTDFCSSIKPDLCSEEFLLLLWLC